MHIKIVEENYKKILFLYIVIYDQVRVLKVVNHNHLYKTPSPTMIPLPGKVISSLKTFVP